MGAAAKALPSWSPPAVVRSLGRWTETYPLEHKLLIVPEVTYGRELLATLARWRGSWVGWEVATLRRLASELALVPLARDRLREADDIELASVLRDAVKAAAIRVDIDFCDNGASPSDALGKTLRELRECGIRPADVRVYAEPRSLTAFLAVVLEEYERLLDMRRLADSARVYRAALNAFDSQAPYVITGPVFFVPELVVRGSSRELAQRLLAAGAEVLGADLPGGAVCPETSLAALRSGSAPEASPGSLLAWCGSTVFVPERLPPSEGVVLDFFAAATPTDEIREVLRRAVGEGWQWGDVEIAAANPDRYAIIMDAVAQQLDVPVTIAGGIPLGRTRLGSLLDRWFFWLEQECPDRIVRELLEANEFRLPDGAPAGAWLSAELRRCRIGWGVQRYRAAIAALRESTAVPVDASGDSLEAEEREVRQRAQLALADFMERLLDVLPLDCGGEVPREVSIARLAASSARWLELLKWDDVAEESLLARVRGRLWMLERMAAQSLPWADAVGLVRTALMEMRAWPVASNSRQPWASNGGAIHFTSLEHAGASGRPRVFVVGLDAESAASRERSDPLLNDRLRQCFGGGLALERDRRVEAEFRALVGMARLRGRVTLSYARRVSLDGRHSAPSPLLLQAFRLVEKDARLGYVDLEKALSPLATPIPGATASCLDERDVFLAAIGRGAVLADASVQIAERFPGLARGLEGLQALQETSLGRYHGLVPDAGSPRDRLLRSGRQVSASELERLARCPLSWFYRYVLGVRPPDDVRFDSGAWLDKLTRGAVLHEVFEEAGRRFKGREKHLARPEIEAELLSIVDAVAERWRTKYPPPNDVVWERECDRLRRAARAFLDREREEAPSHRGRWHAVETEFGGDRPGKLSLSDGRVLVLRGRIDRVDLLRGGRAHVVDYKTGSSDHYSKQGPPFHGGRRLQPVVYAAAVEEVLGLTTSAFEYLFVSPDGEVDSVIYSRAELDAGLPVLERVLSYGEGGAFVPTSDGQDCKLCEYQTICRVTSSEYGELDSPRARWAREKGEALPQYAALKRNRERVANGH